MLIDKSVRKQIYQELFLNGVLIAEKKYEGNHTAKGLKEIPNLVVIKALTSMKSKGYVKEQFAWRHFYWTLTNDGINYIRELLHLPDDVVPKPYQKEKRKLPSMNERGGGGGNYQDSRETQDKKADVGPGTSQPLFSGGAGRGQTLPE
ncbi:hypothetical protein SNEBB_000628 [Seison nebaliae]|nr:hypothetical protein SNEBB_000628 [Seison nebaliae]